MGTIRLSEAVRLVKNNLGISSVGEDIISKVIFNVERQVSFD
jgi:hypothetical protein